ncbi:MAG: DNA repair protein RecN [Sandaracinaceae bacterium]|jgi:DNA repair protein RecN (Recombination protein N)|nr:DNA repair protein RecN [Sandaracinaceae bacterium]
MLTCLRVRDFAIIDSLEVTLGPGLSVVTGQTGAGKSILINALSLLLGGRANPDMVRSGAESAEVEACFDLEQDAALVARLEAAGIGPEEELIVRRVISANGRSRAYINGRLATSTQLAEVAVGLADISSQHEHHTLVDPKTHLDYLDAHARLLDSRTEMTRAYEALALASRALSEIRTREQGRLEREDLLRFQVREIDELGIAVDEESVLRDERERLRHAEKLSGTAGRAEDALYTADGAICEALGKITHEIDEAARLDSSLLKIAAELSKSRVELEDVARELGRYARSVTSDAERLAEVEERLDRLNRLKRKYGGSVESILLHRDTAKAELETLERFEEERERLARIHVEALNNARQLAKTLSEKRRAGAKKLGVAITKELRSVGMGDATVEVALAAWDSREGELAIDGARVTATGMDRAEFLIAPNLGEEARPIHRIASGGELSRAMLAIKRVLAGLGTAGLYVFDEVDAGVGGAVAEVIAQKLKEVSKHHQVLCITHLPQIAVYGDTHFHVAKEVVKDRTRSTITKLSNKERREEIARMLGGLTITTKTRAAAAEMLRAAH